MTTKPLLRIGHSPDPDDAFMFYALATGAVQVDGYRVEHVLAEIEDLNARALRGELEVTAVSAHAYAHLAGRYRVLRCGASVGRGYGPVVVARPGAAPTHDAARDRDGRRLRVALPGARTTAALLARLYLGDFEPVVRSFTDVLAAVDRGEADAAVVIHEAQLTYAADGWTLVHDLAGAWARDTGLPLPLGLDVVRTDLGLDVARRVGAALRASIDHARAHFDEALAYALRFGRGLAADLGARFVRMYVNDDTADLGAEGLAALHALYGRAHAAGLLPAVPVLEVV
ncbi:MAG TPA: MqnA/MqnD/SBP family protein [Myxococcota bacterium]|jgi:1,4-dihydroxy-6-naphthoate synthase|nr:MqnA/MqnD/SBP family protein [Myxococcota bacterium]